MTETIFSPLFLSFLDKATALLEKVGFGHNFALITVDIYFISLCLLAAFMIEEFVRKVISSKEEPAKKDFDK